MARIGPHHRSIPRCGAARMELALSVAQLGETRVGFGALVANARNEPVPALGPPCMVCSSSQQG